MKFEINFSKYINSMFPDEWRWATIEADSEDEAIKKLINDNDGKLNYILSVTEVK